MFKQLLPPRWLKLSLVASLSFVSVTSCTKEVESPNPATDASRYAVSEAQARTAAENINLSAETLAQRVHNAQKGDTQRVFVGRQRISNLTALPAADGKPGLYICNYEQGGFAIIAADRHMRPILSFATHGSMAAKDLRDIRLVPGGLTDWLETTKQIVVALRQNPGEENVESGASLAWKALVDNPQPEPPITNLKSYSVTAAAVATKPKPGDPINRFPADPTPPPSYSVQRGPLLQTTWGQGCGYNDYTPSTGVRDYCYHSPTGCVATAMAQVMNYWHYPASFDWAAMRNDVGTPATASLMKSCGATTHMKYGDTSSGTDDDYVDDMLKAWYGYRSADYISNEDPGLYQNVIDNLNNGQPVLLGGFTDTTLGFPSGSGHSWVCDGYIQSYSEGYGYLSYHMNWGWDGFYNCWCAYNNWEVKWSDGSVHQYKYAKVMTLNIHP